MKRNLYQILGVPTDASAVAIQEAFASRQEQFATAGNADANEVMFVKEAFRILSDPDRRARYDESLVTPDVSAILIHDHSHRSTAAIPRPVLWLMAASVVAVCLWGIWHLGARKPGAPPNRAAEPEVHLIQLEPGAANTTEARKERSPEDLYTMLSKSIVLVSTYDTAGQLLGTGSGVVVGQSDIVTNCHVTRNGSSHKVKLGEVELSATVATSDEEFDLCRLSVVGLSAPAVQLGRSSMLRSGQKVYALGAPRGLELTISDGIVSALRAVENGTVIQTTTPVSPGSSGGGLFDATGTLVGIITFQHAYGQNLNFAVPAEWISEMRDRTSSKAEQKRAENSVPPYRPSNVANPKLLGSWACFNPVTGGNIEITFMPNGTLTMIRLGKTFTGYYTAQGNDIRLVSADVLQGRVEDITDQRFVVFVNTGVRVVCNRK